MRCMVVTAVCLAAAPVLAEDLSRSITDVTTIADRGAARVLFKTGAPVEPGAVAVQEATITFPVTGALDRRKIELRVHPVTTRWEPGSVDWNSGWSRPGGDFDEELYSWAEWDLADGSELVLDVTLLMKAILEDGRPAEGFIVTVDPERGRGIRADDLSRLAALASASLEVEYRKVPPRPGRRAARAEPQRESGVLGEAPRAP